MTLAVYRIAAVGNGQTPPYPTLVKDMRFLLKVFFPGTLLLWCCLWLVKLSLLLNCRRLIDRQPGYILPWWWIVGTVIITFMGCVITELTSCRTLHDWFTPGQNMVHSACDYNVLNIRQVHAPPSEMLEHQP